MGLRQHTTWIFGLQYLVSEHIYCIIYCFVGIVCQNYAMQRGGKNEISQTFQPIQQSYNLIKLNIDSDHISSDRQNKEHIRENRTKNRTNNRQNRMLQKNPNILLFIRLELYRITRPNSFVFILQNNQTEMALLGQTVLPPEPFPFFENTRFLVFCSRGLSKWACCCPHDGQNL